MNSGYYISGYFQARRLQLHTNHSRLECIVRSTYGVFVTFNECTNRGTVTKPCFDSVASSHMPLYVFIFSSVQTKFHRVKPTTPGNAYNR